MPCREDIVPNIEGLPAALEHNLFKDLDDQCLELSSRKARLQEGKEQSNQKIGKR